MSNQYDLLQKQDTHLTEWMALSANSHLGFMQDEIDAKNTVTVNASGAVSAGQIVQLNDNGFVSGVWENPDSATTPVTGSDVLITGTMLTPYDPVSEKTLVFWSTTGALLAGAITEISGSTVQWNDDRVLSSDYAITMCSAYHERNQTTIVVAGWISFSNIIRSVSVSGNTLVEEIEAPIGFSFDSIGMTYDPVAEKAIMFYTGAYDANYSVVTIEVSGATFSIDTPTVFGVGHGYGLDNICFDTTAGMFITCFELNTLQTGHITNGNEITFDESKVFEASGNFVMYSIIYLPDINRFVFNYSDTVADATISYVRVGKIENSLMVLGDRVVFTGVTNTNIDCFSYDTTDRRLWMTYVDSSYHAALREVVVDDLTVTLGDELILYSASTVNDFSMVYQPNTENFIYYVNDAPNTLIYNGIFTPGGSSLTSDNFLGIAQDIDYDGANNTSTIDAVPTMLSNNTPSGSASVSSIVNGTYPVWHVFDDFPIPIDINVSGWLAATNTNEWVQYEFPSARLINKYTLSSSSNAVHINGMPRDFTLQGSNDGILYDILDTQTGIIWVVNEKKAFTFIVSEPYTHFKLNTTANNGFIYILLGELELISPPVVVGTLGNMDTNQTGLTVPSKYYSDKSGNLTTATGVEIGKSSSTTDIIITG